MTRALPALVAALTLSAAATTRAVEPEAPPAPKEAEVRQAVARGLALVRKAVASYPTHRQCFSCHHQTLPALAMTHARDRGLDPDGGALLREQAEFTLESFQDKLEPMRAGNG